MEEPVAKASSSSIKPNSVLLHRQNSSLKRLICIISVEAKLKNSII